MVRCRSDGADAADVGGGAKSESGTRLAQSLHDCGRRRRTNEGKEEEWWLCRVGNARYLTGSALPGIFHFLVVYFEAILLHQNDANGNLIQI